MSFVDSKAVFKSRVAQLGLPEILPNFEAYGYDTYSSLAFAVDYQPGGDATAFNTILLPRLTDGDTVWEAKVRRLHFEAYASTMAEYQRRGSRANDDTVRVVPPEERDQRLEMFKAKYFGFQLDFQKFRNQMWFFGFSEFLLCLCT